MAQMLDQDLLRRRIATHQRAIAAGAPDASARMAQIRLYQSQLDSAAGPGVSAVGRQPAPQAATRSVQTQSRPNPQQTAQLASVQARSRAPSSGGLDAATLQARIATHQRNLATNPANKAAIEAQIRHYQGLLGSGAVARQAPGLSQSLGGEEQQAQRAQAQQALAAQAAGGEAPLTFEDLQRKRAELETKYGNYDRGGRDEIEAEMADLLNRQRQTAVPGLNPEFTVTPGGIVVQRTKPVGSLDDLQAGRGVSSFHNPGVQNRQVFTDPAVLAQAQAAAQSGPENRFEAMARNARQNREWRVQPDGTFKLTDRSFMNKLGPYFPAIVGGIGGIAGAVTAPVAAASSAGSAGLSAGLAGSEAAAAGGAGLGAEAAAAGVLNPANFSLTGAAPAITAPTFGVAPGLVAPTVGLSGAIPAAGAAPFSVAPGLVGPTAAETFPGLGATLSGAENVLAGATPPGTPAPTAAPAPGTPPPSTPPTIPAPGTAGGILTKPIDLLGGLTGKEALGLAGTAGGLGLALFGGGGESQSIPPFTPEPLPPMPEFAPEGGGEGGGGAFHIPDEIAQFFPSADLINSFNALIDTILGDVAGLPKPDDATVKAKADELIKAELLQLEQDYQKAHAQVMEESNFQGTNPAGRLAELDRAKLLAQEQIRAGSFQQALALIQAQQAMSIGRITPAIQMAQLLDPTRALGAATNLFGLQQQRELAGMELGMDQQALQWQMALAQIQSRNQANLLNYQTQIANAQRASQQRAQQQALLASGLIGLGSRLF